MFYPLKKQRKNKRKTNKKTNLNKITKCLESNVKKQKKKTNSKSFCANIFLIYVCFNERFEK